MTPAPRKVSDDEVFAAARRAMVEVDPRHLTLARIASEAGVTAGALVQRFGSKLGLLRALADASATSAALLPDRMREAHRSPLRALRAYAECMGELARSPAALARNLAYLQTDLEHADLREQLSRHATATRAGLERLLREAVGAGELSAATPVQRTARLVETVISGSLLTWAVYQDGEATAWIRRDLDIALAPYRRGRDAGRRDRS